MIWENKQNSEDGNFALSCEYLSDDAFPRWMPVKSGSLTFTCGKSKSTSHKKPTLTLLGFYGFKPCVNVLLVDLIYCIKSSVRLILKRLIPSPKNISTDVFES